MMLVIRQLKKAYGNYMALDGLDITIEPGALYGLVGPNGAGKTTTIKIMTSLLLPDSGTVEIDGVDAIANPGKLKAVIGYVPDYFGTYDNLKVAEYMEFFASCYGMEGLKARKRSLTLLEQVGLEDRMDAFVDGLSRGMKQRLCLARALIHNPKMLIMDEPTAGLDPRTRLEFKQIVKELQEQGKTVLISSHILSELSELCTHIGVLEQGKMLLEGSIAEIENSINTSNPLIISVLGETQAALNLLKEHDLVKTISVKEQELMITFAGTSGEEAALLKELVEAGIPVRSFVRRQGGLESIFMQVTERQKERVVLVNEAESGL